MAAILLSCTELTTKRLPGCEPGHHQDGRSVVNAMLRTMLCLVQDALKNA